VARTPSRSLARTATPTAAATATSTAAATATSTAAATATSTAAPVAYRIPEAIALKLPHADAYAVIEREGDVVAESEWEDYTAPVLSAWLEDKHGIRIDALEYRSVTSRLGSEQELYVIVVTGEHAAALCGCTRANAL
jgi:hypothetical protein